jgi:dephospho-CoA kinase
VKRCARIGITGKLGTGKSVLIRLMEERGYTVLRTDELAREIMERDAALRKKLIEILGPQTYNGEKLDRCFVASRVFEDNTLLKKVEAVVHPAVTKEVEKVCALQAGGAVAVESALVLRTRFREIFDYIVLVESPDAASIERVIKEGRLSAADAKARLREQDISEEDRAEADLILENDGLKEAFELKCQTMIDILDAIATRELPEEPLHAKIKEDNNKK